MGIVNGEDYQIVYSDTPGVLAPNYKLQQSMLNFSNSALVDADILLYITDIIEQVDKHDSYLSKVQGLSIPVLVIINKIDLTTQEELEFLVDTLKSKMPNAEIIPISALRKFNVSYVFKRIQELLPESPPYFDKDALTDKPARFFITEIIREKLLLYYQQEIPYASEVVVEQFEDKPNLVRINAVIYVERDTQKGIIIGHGGKALKKVGTEARKDIESFLGKKVYLELYVRVEKDWRNKETKLKSFGYQLD